MKLVIVEDTQSINGGYSLILNSLFQKNDHFLDTFFVYWNSPCHAWSSVGQPIFSSFPNYLHSKIQSKNSTIFPRLLSDDDFLLIHSFLAQCCSNLVFNSSTLSILSYQGIQIGQSVLSFLLRQNSSFNLSSTIDNKFVIPLLYDVLRGIFSIRNLASIYSLHACFFSESTYLSSSLVQQSLRLGARVPYFYSLDSPVILKPSYLSKRYLPDLLGASIRQQAFQDQFTSQPRLSELLFRLKDNNSINTINSSGKLLLKDFYIDTLPSEFSLLSDSTDLINLYRKTNITFVFYLHAVSDGAFEKGFSGFADLNQFYLSILTTLLDLKIDFNLIIRPHPNLFHTLNSPFHSQVSRVSIERDIYSSFLSQISCIISTSSHVSVSVALPSFASRYLLSLPDSFHCSHHGTISLEAIALGLNCVTSYSSALSLQPVIGNCFFFSSASSSSSFLRFIDSCCSDKTTPFSQFPSSKLVLPDYGNNIFSNTYLKKLRSWGPSYNFFDYYIYNNDLSWSNFNNLNLPSDIIAVLSSMVSCCEESLYSNFK